MSKLFFFMVSVFLSTAHAAEKTELATFAGGCFWCMESPFEKLDGVKSVISGYTAGKKENPTYEEVSAGTTGHTEAVQITYDSSKVSYAKLLEILWRNMDPTDAEGQFVDRGTQYRPGVYFHSPEQKKLAEASKAELQKSKRYKKPVVAEITQFTKFYPAEDYHQDYYKKNPVRYEYYRFRSGRDQFLKGIWANEGATARKE